MRVILDTNVFISAFIFGGKIQNIFELLLDDSFELVTCEELNNEILDKLINKFKISETKFEIVISIFTKSIDCKLKKIEKHTRDPKDDFLIQLAIESNADYLVSGDKDVLILKEISGTKIILPSEFLKLIHYD
jgi:uncharacterized protein